MITYDIIIIGGGPVGIALAIELGLHGIKTLVLEKYEAPLHTPRAQSLNARTMEFFLRWGIDEHLESRLLLPSDLPQNGIWCSTLNGTTYFAGTLGDNNLLNNESPKQAVRVPLWITEDVLRQRLKDFSCVTFLKSFEVKKIALHDNYIELESFDRRNNRNVSHKGHFLACCDGALGPSKKILNNSFNALSPCSKILSISFASHEVISKKTVPDGIFYSTLTKELSGFLSPVDLKEGLWLAQVVWTYGDRLPNDAELSDILEKMIGETFKKQITEYHFWDMQVQIADFFNLNNRVFWLGDAAHAFAPTGGLGLNTGFGDAQNLGWKLAHVIKGKIEESLLFTYEKERYPIWMDNLAFAKKNADDFLKIKQLYPIDKDLDAFAKANAQLGKQFLDSSKLTLGYRYGTQHNRITGDNMPDLSYKPITEPGYFLPHALIKDGQSIYKKLSATEWNLVVCGADTKIVMDNIVNKIPKPHVVRVDEGTYPHNFLLLRPDWHIAQIG